MTSLTTEERVVDGQPPPFLCLDNFILFYFFKCILIHSFTLRRSPILFKVTAAVISYRDTQITSESGSAVDF